MKQDNNLAQNVVAALGLIFITLKLMGHIDWSWWWVLTPFWIPVFLVVIVAMVVGGIQGYKSAMSDKE